MAALARSPRRVVARALVVVALVAAVLGFYIASAGQPTFHDEEPV